jgi:hypothetical protein
MAGAASRLDRAASEAKLNAHGLQMSKHGPKPPARKKEELVPELALSHGQTLWLMDQLGLRHDVSASTFNHYVKSLRKLGIPFDKGKGQSEGRRPVTYDFEDLMELTIALILRVYGTFHGTIVTGLRQFLVELRPMYRQGYLDSLKRLYPATRLSERGGDSIKSSGLYLDLNIRYSLSQTIEFGPPKLLSPFEALKAYALSECPATSYLPLNISLVAQMIVAGTRSVPPLQRRGRRRGSTTA